MSEGGEAIHFSAFIIIDVLIQRATFVLLFFSFFLASIPAASAHSLLEEWSP